MEELMKLVDFTAVFVGFLISFLLGWLWFSPKLFGSKWADGVPGVSIDDDCQKPPALAMLTQALAVFGLAWIVGLTISHNALPLLILIVCTIILFIISNGKFAQKNNTAVIVEATYVIAMTIIMVTCQNIM